MARFGLQGALFSISGLAVGGESKRIEVRMHLTFMPRTSGIGIYFSKMPSDPSKSL